MEQEKPKPVTLEKKEKEPLSPEREKLEVKLKEIEIDTKLQELASNTSLDNLEIERRQLENEDVKRRGSGWNSPISQLIEVARAWCIDNDKTVIGSEPALRSLWDEVEMAELRSLIMKKARKL